jgi:hypothetical protein
MKIAYSVPYGPAFTYENPVPSEGTVGQHA